MEENMKPITMSSSGVYYRNWLHHSVTVQ